MTRYHHLYPYPPWGWYGGTLRLRTALDASQLLGVATVSWWDRSKSVWREVAPHDVGGTAPEPVVPFATTGLKRRLFPSTLWESGIKPRRTAADAFPQDDATIVLHTSYLAPLANGLRQRGLQVVVDLHDLVFRAHSDDAALASTGLRITRHIYSRSVKAREQRSLAKASDVVTAGWDDMLLLRELGLVRAAWAPIGMEVSLSPPIESDRLCVGLIGNFAHSATAAAAHNLTLSPLAKDPGVHIILAGAGSEQWAASSDAVALGPVQSVNDFYDRVHATVVPVTNGSGMKCKLGEAALAGKAVITTALGAAGYPPELRDAFILIDGAQPLDRGMVQSAVQATSPLALRDRFDRVMGRKAAAAAYASLLDSHLP